MRREICNAHFCISFFVIITVIYNNRLKKTISAYEKKTTSVIMLIAKRKVMSTVIYQSVHHTELLSYSQPLMLQSSHHPSSLRSVCFYYDCYYFIFY